MKILKRLLFCVVLMVCLYITLHVTPVYACSGYPYFGVSNLPEADVLVKATVIDADDSGYSAVLRVEDYYKGSGSRYVTVMRFPPALQTGALVRGYDTGCLYAGQGGYWNKGSQGYFGLAPNGDGTFTDYINGSAQFYPVNGKISYQEGATEGYAVEFDAPLEMTEKDFITKLLAAGNRKAAVPPTGDSPAFYPLMRFVNITTKNGTRYQINPDRSIKKVENTDLLAISPDGAHLAFRASADTIAFQYIWTTYSKEGSDNAPLNAKDLMVKGQAVSFSSDNNLVAVWDTTHVSIYMISNQGEQHEYEMNLHEIAVHPFAPGKALPKVLWSANGSTLAWQEANAIWYWNLFDQAKPKQLMKGSTLPPLIDLSRYGRYVRVGNWNEWRLMDTQSGKSYPNTIASPNELYLIAINHKERSDVEFGGNKQTCKPPLRENCQKEIGVGALELRDVYAFQMELLGFASCKPDNTACFLASQSWHPAIGRTHYSGGRYYYVFIKEFRSISYDVQYQKPVVLVGDYGIYFNLYSDDDVAEEQYRPYLDILDLNGKVDSPIVSADWGQPVFYDTYKLSSIEYHP